MQTQDEGSTARMEAGSPTGADAPTTARTAQPPDGRGEAAPACAPSSNRAHANYIEGTGRVLRCAIDSLYVSFNGELSENKDFQLKELKEQAQSDSELTQSRAQLQIGPHLFQVLDHGKKKRCPYILDNSDMRVEIGRGAGGVPLAHVQIKNQFLTEAGIDQAISAVRFVVASLGKVEGIEKVSRADLCADFIPSIPMTQWPNDNWLTRAKRRTPHYEGDRFTGWSIGKGMISARLYDKLFELVTVSKKEYLLMLWAQGGWQMGEPVWRLEFQLRRAALKEMQVSGVDELLTSLAGIWAYCSEHWLLLKVPSGDSNSTRWPLHALWALLQGAQFGDLRQAALARTRPCSLPSDDWLFTNGFGPFTSYMAREGITDLREGLAQFFAAACDFHERNGTSAESYTEVKVKAKGRKFGTMDNRVRTLAEKGRQEASAGAYRRAKDGE